MVGPHINFVVSSNKMNTSLVDDLILWRKEVPPILIVKTSIGIAMSRLVKNRDVSLPQ